MSANNTGSESWRQYFCEKKIAENSAMFFFIIFFYRSKSQVSYDVRHKRTITLVHVLKYLATRGKIVIDKVKILCFV